MGEAVADIFNGSLCGHGVTRADEVGEALIGTDDALGAKGQTIVLFVELDFSLIEVDLAFTKGGVAIEVTEALDFTVFEGTACKLIAISIGVKGAREDRFITIGTELKTKRIATKGEFAVGVWISCSVLEIGIFKIEIN